jgi:hypothetical protein
MLSLGTVKYGHAEPVTIDELMLEADRLMYQQKRLKKELALDNYLCGGNPESFERKTQ